MSAVGELSVGQAAAVLGVVPSRVHQLLRSGGLPGRRHGRDWIVDGAAVARLAQDPHRGGRPMSPARAWGLLDLLDGGSAPWLSAVARSQVRVLLRSLAGGSAGSWRDALRARSVVRPVRVHPSVLERVAAGNDLTVLAAGAALAAGADLVVLEPMAEIYLRAEHWEPFVARWHPREGPAEPNLLVRIPRMEPWPFARSERVGAPVLAADLLESAEPRAVVAGAAQLNALAAGQK